MPLFIFSQMHWLKTDFDKWVDEDESEDEDPSAGKRKEDTQCS